MTLRALALAPAVAAALSSAACGGNNLASHGATPPSFDPKDQTKCSVARSQSKPLVVEWPSSDRAELESAMRKSIVVVRYSGCELEVLDRCTAPSSYGYAGTTRKKDRVEMRSADDLYANVPVGAASLEAKLATSGELDVDMVIVGRLESQRTLVKKNELSGEDCARATHVVSALTVGAFNFTAGASAKVGAGATVAGAGAGGGSRASREVLKSDGDAAACEKSQSGDTKPPEGCGAVLRIELVPVAEAACPIPWLKWDGHACVRSAPRATEAQRRECKHDDADDCDEQCRLGDDASCLALHSRYADGPARDDAKAQAYARLACDDGFGAGCHARSCDLGACSGCNELGLDLYADQGPRDLTAARATFERVVAGTSGTQCDRTLEGFARLGWMLHRGEGGPRDDARAEQVLVDACNKGNQDGCAKLDSMRKENASAGPPSLQQTAAQLLIDVRNLIVALQDIRKRVAACPAVAASVAADVASMLKTLAGYEATLGRPFPSTADAEQRLVELKEAVARHTHAVSMLAQEAARCTKK